MTTRTGDSFRFFGSGNIAFLLVVCASYASAITALIYSGKPVAPWEVVALIVIAMMYLVIGTYGFAQVRRSESIPQRLMYFVVQLLLAGILILLRGSAGELSLVLLPL